MHVDSVIDLYRVGDAEIDEFKSALDEDEICGLEILRNESAKAPRTSYTLTKRTECTMSWSWTAPTHSSISFQ